MRIFVREVACKLLGLFCVHVWFGTSLSKIQSHDGTGGLRGTTMNVATLPELFMYSLEKERDTRHHKRSTTLRRLPQQQERSFCKKNMRMQPGQSIVDIFRLGACMQNSKGHSIRPRNMLPNGPAKKYR